MNRKFIKKSKAISPVIAIILMVAITVAVAAPIYLYVSNMPKPPPSLTVILNLKYNEATGELTIMHLSGHIIEDVLSTYSSNGLLLHLDASNPNSYPGTGNYWYDLLGKTTLSNTGLSFTTKDGEKCFHFDGSHYFHGSGTNVPMDGAFTLEMWYYHDGISERDTIFEKAGDTYSSYRQEIACTLETSRIMSYYWGHSPTYDYGGTPAMSIGSWHQIVVTREHGDSGCKSGSGYIDASDSGSYYGCRATASIVPTSGDIRIGTGYAGPVEDGYIKIVRVYNRVLTVEEIRASYNPGWKNLEVKFNGQLFDINSVSCSSGSDFRAGSTLTITQSLNSGDKISIVYKPANQLLRQYTIP